MARKLQQPFLRQSRRYLRRLSPRLPLWRQFLQQNPGRSFDDVDSELCQNWDSARGNSKLPWAHAKHAVRDSWHRVSDRVERAIPGDSDRDGK